MSILTATPSVLHPGDRLNADEFLARYERMPGVKAQLIEGVVHMPSPLRAEDHGDPHADLMLWLGLYRMATPGVQPSIAATTRLSDTAVPEPDASLRIVQGGQTQMRDGYIVGPPELAIEIAASSVSIDRHAKWRDYLRHGVREYLLWRVDDAAIDWWVARDGQFVALEADALGIVRSTVFPGLWLDPAALLRRDLAQVLAVVQHGLASPEHAAFVVQRTSGA
jgi:Uma2 family endonuclease